MNSLQQHIGHWHVDLSSNEFIEKPQDTDRPIPIKGESVAVLIFQIWIRWVIWSTSAVAKTNSLLLYTKNLVKRFILVCYHGGFESSLRPHFELLSNFSKEKKKNPLDEIMIASLMSLLPHSIWVQVVQVYLHNNATDSLCFRLQLSI